MCAAPGSKTGQSPPPLLLDMCAAPGSKTGQSPLGWLTFWKCWIRHAPRSFPGSYWFKNTPKKFSAIFDYFYYMQRAVLCRKRLKCENTYMGKGQLSHTYLCDTPKCPYWWGEQTSQINMPSKISSSLSKCTKTDFFTWNLCFCVKTSRVVHYLMRMTSFHSFI